MDSNETLTVWVDHEGATVIRDLRAGVSGPLCKESSAVTREQADSWLQTKGYQRVEDWRARQSYKGEYHTAQLMRR